MATEIGDLPDDGSHQTRAPLEGRSASDVTTDAPRGKLERLRRT
jgi:hypothetical protein